MTDTALHAPRIVRPLDRIHDGIEARIHEITEMTTPTFFRFHDRSDASPIHSHNADRRQAVPDAFVWKISARMCCRLATAQAIGVAYLQTVEAFSATNPQRALRETRLAALTGAYIEWNFLALMQ